MSNYSIAAVIQKTFIEELPAKNVQAYSISSNILTYDFTGKVKGHETSSSEKKD